VKHAGELAHIDPAPIDANQSILQDSAEPKLGSKWRESLLDRVERLSRMRRRRDTIFGEHVMFADPSWDILLDLFIAHLRNRQISITSACTASRVPQTTGLRWLSLLENDGLVTREKDPLDARRIFVHLTKPAVTKMTKAFELG
jgi:hypothetical protein